MGRIPDHIVEDVRARADIVAVIGRYVTLRKSGARHLGLCPFHSEKTPSFSVHEERQIFYCFGCGEGGDVFSFRMRHEGLDFPDAVRALAREVGVEIPETGGGTGGRVMQVHRANDSAAQYFQGVLRSREGAAARRYLEGRNVDAELQERFRLGFAPPRWDGLLSHLGGGADEIAVAERAGLVARRQTGDGHYDRFRARVIFPIVEPNGRVIGFGGRALDDGEPKYLNSPETAVYKKSRALFGLAQAVDAVRGSGRAVLVEGYFDVLALHRAGLPEAVAPCGTAVTRDHARRLRRYTREVVLLFDGDEAGRRAAERSLPVLLAEGLRVRAAFLPVGEDPDTLLEHHGAEALRACVENAVVLLDHLMDERLRGASAGAWAKSDAVAALAPWLSAQPDPIERAEYVRRLAARLELPVAAVEASLGGGRAPEPTPDPEAERPGRIAVGELDAVSRTLIAAVSAFPTLVARLESPALRGLPAGPGLDIIEQLVASTREHGPRPLARLVSGADDALRPELREALAAIAAAAEPLDAAGAERAVQDCLDHLERRLWEREAHTLTARLREARDPNEIESLLAEKQRLLEERRAPH